MLWGTDSICYGSPQNQIQTFRSFQISPALIEAKIFGLNGAGVGFGSRLLSWASLNAITWCSRLRVGLDCRAA